MVEVLKGINSPEDLKLLGYQELDKLAAELREEMIKTISANGGHLASSLGAVELTLALHRIFNSPNDKIIWDVGQQSYAHKIITGRKDRFSTIRQYGGLAGFPMRGESPHDVFTTGHAGTSISAALGMALARDLKKEKYDVIAVIGDGSLGTGMSFEAVNHAGRQNTKLIVVLNDNGMAISPTRGALSRLLNQVRMDTRYEQAKSRFSRIMQCLPLGKTALEYSREAKKGIERVLLPNAFWEQMGFVYLGPLDGHDIRALESALIRARDFETRPVLIHVLTTKGKGYSKAENDATRFHGISPCIPDQENGSCTYSQAFGDAVIKLMRRDKKIITISAAMIDGTGLSKAAAEFPDRVIDVGICEQHAVTLAAGAAAQGLKPIVAVYSTFLQRSYDQIVQDVCLQKLPVVFAIDRAGIVGEDGATHHGALDISYMRSVPNMIIAAPKDEAELQHMLLTAVESDSPFAIRFPRGHGESAVLSEELHSIEIGKAEVLREGKDLTIFAIGSMVYPSLQAAEMLSKQGVECAVINSRFAKPLDSGLIMEYVRKSGGRAVTVEENVLTGGFGSGVDELIIKNRIEINRLVQIGLPDEFVLHGKCSVLRGLYGLDAEGIANRIASEFPEFNINVENKKEA
jgi:1-deoxy-D-xylulose-5-phosphate synthase